MNFGNIYGNTFELVPGTSEIRSKLQTPTTLGLRLGSKHASISTDVTALVAKIGIAAEKVQRLAGDQTRSQGQKHLDGRTVARQISAEIARTQGIVRAKAADLNADGTALIDAVLGPQDKLNYLYSEIRQWVRQTKNAPEGLKQINEGLKENVTIAAAIYHSPAQLMNLSKDMHISMASKCCELWAPTGWAKVNEAVAVEKFLPIYDAVTADFHRIAYRPDAVAEAEASRVEI